MVRVRKCVCLADPRTVRIRKKICGSGSADIRVRTPLIVTLVKHGGQCTFSELHTQILQQDVENVVSNFAIIVPTE